MIVHMLLITCWWNLVDLGGFNLGCLHDLTYVWGWLKHPTGQADVPEGIPNSFQFTCAHARNRIDIEATNVKELHVYGLCLIDVIMKILVAHDAASKNVRKSVSTYLRLHISI